MDEDQSPLAVFELNVTALTNGAERWNARAVQEYREHYRQLTLSWGQGVKFEHRDPRRRWAVTIDRDKLEATLYLGEEFVIDKLPDPWDLPPVVNPPNVAYVGGPVGPWLPGWYHATEKTTVEQGHVTTHEGQQLVLEVFWGPVGKRRYWRPLEEV